MAGAATLLTDAFTQAVIYWRANAGGTRAGLIAHLQSTVGITQLTAARWVDAMMQEAYDLAIIDDATYPSFKARLIEVGPTRALHGAKCVFENLREGALMPDAKAELLAQKDETISLQQVRLDAVNAAVLYVQGLSAGAERDEALVALAARVVRLSESIARLQADRTELSSAT